MTRHNRWPHFRAEFILHGIRLTSERRTITQRIFVLSDPWKAFKAIWRSNCQSIALTIRPRLDPLLFPGTVRVGLFKIPAETESKQSSKRKTKSRPKVWEKVAWFTRRSKSGKEGKSTPESTRKGNENRLTVDELSVTRASSLKKTNSVRKTKSFCNLKRRKETELTVGIGSNLHERDLDTRPIGDVTQQLALSTTFRQIDECQAKSEWRAATTF